MSSSSKPQGKIVKNTFRSKLLEDDVFNNIPTNQKTVTSLDDNTKKVVRIMYNKFKGDLGITKPASNIEWVGPNHEKIIEYILKNYKSNNTQHAYLNSLAKTLLAINKHKYKEKVRDILQVGTEQKNTYLKRQEESELSESEKKSFVCFGDIVKERDRLKQISAKDPKNFVKHQDYLILALNTYIPPLRMDWADMEIWKDKTKLPPKNVTQNYIYEDINKKGTWIYLINWDKIESKRDVGLSDPLSYKLADEITAKGVSITNGKLLNAILTDSFRRFKRDWVLVGSTSMDTPLEKTRGYYSILRKIFKPRSPTQNTIRKSYINHWYDSMKLSTAVKKKIASRMRHDMKTAALTYVKVDIECPADGRSDIVGVQEKEVQPVERPVKSEYFDPKTYQDKWRLKNADKVKEYRAISYAKNKEKILAKKQLWYLNHSKVKKPTTASEEKYQLSYDPELERWVSDLV